MKVEFVKLHPDFAYAVGDVASFKSELAKGLIEAGYAILAKDEVALEETEEPVIETNSESEIETADSKVETNKAVKGGKKR